MHEIQTCRNCITRTEVISHSTAHVDRKREVLSLRICHALGSLSVNVPQAEPYIKVGRDPRVARNKVTSNTHEVSEIPCLRSPGNGGNGPAAGQIPIATQNRGTSYAVQMPPERSDDGHEGVFKRIRVVGIAYENVKRERDIDGEPSCVQGELELVSVIDVSVE